MSKKEMAALDSDGELPHQVKMSMSDAIVYSEKLLGKAAQTKRNLDTAKNNTTTNNDQSGANTNFLPARRHTAETDPTPTLREELS